MSNHHVEDLGIHRGALGVSDVYRKHISELYKIFRLRTTIRILFVVDTEISLTEIPSAFGVGRVIRLLRESHIGCTYFSVDIARRSSLPATTNNSPAANQPRYEGFRFDQEEGGQPIINKYDEVWCFGFKPGNDAGPDSNITQAFELPASDGELRVLTTWMNERRGGLLAMGDHDYLGASMCHRIPRIRSMRRWTNAQGVPPIGHITNPDTHLRHDTNQPATPAQINNGAFIDFLVQEDTVPQKIDWVPWMAQQLHVFRIIERPHPILCHPTHGPIDVLPDHPHEGWCYENDEIDLDATYTFGALTGDEYPKVGGNPHGPTVIAHGTTTPNPPFNLEKGPSPKKRFGQISVYDGHPAQVGRVVTDATWHHWFDENIQAIEAAGGENWDKISRYYLNVATWLAPPGINNWCMVLEVLATHFTYLGFQEYTRKASVLDLGRPLHAYLSRYFGPCWVSRWVFEGIQIVDDDFWAYLKDRLFWKKGWPGPGDPCLSCPPFELFEIAVLGGLVRATFPIADEIKAAAEGKDQRVRKLDVDDLTKLQFEGVRLGLGELQERLAKSVNEMQVMLRAMKR
ncbi:MAG: hypothetical protein ACXW5U_17890 [Thermoanaerobaculia bacterium]